MMDERNIGRTEIVCLCLALVGCLLAISPIGSAPVENKTDDCWPRKQNKPDPEDELCEALPEESGSNNDKFKYDIAASVSYYDKFKYDMTNCTGVTCDYRHECGRAPMNTIRGDKYLPYIVNGQPQRYGSWPSYAVLFHPRVRGNRTDIVRDGGVIISPRHILTCKNCLLDFRNGTPSEVPISQFYVVVGDHTNRTDKYQQSFRLRKKCVPEGFLRFNALTDSDWAVVRIDGTIVFNKFRQPACLPYKRDYDPPANTFIHCFLMGWGLTIDWHGLQRKEETTPENIWPFFMSYPSTIQDMAVEAQPCNLPLRDSNNTMCFKKRDKPGNICIGDHGSPVLCKNPRSNRWTVVGVASAGDRRCSKGMTDWQFLVTKIAPSLEAMKNQCGI